MSQEDKETVKNLARIKEYLEQRIDELNKELEMLKQIVELVDKELVEKSFKKPSIPTEVKEPPKEVSREVITRPEIPTTPEAEEGRVRILKSKTGDTLATVYISPNELRFIINPNINVTYDMKPFSSFLVKKVLEAMNKMDLERVEKGRLAPGQELTYNIVQDGERVKEIVIRNFREEYRLREIVNAIRWTLETIVERQSTHQ